MAAPISLNGQETNLRISDSISIDGKRSVEMLGVWDGIDSATGLSDRSLQSLQPSDVVGCLSSRTGRPVGEVTVGADTAITVVPLPAGVYECQYVASDMLGNKIKSDVLTYRVSELPEKERTEDTVARCEPISIEQR